MCLDNNIVCLSCVAIIVFLTRGTIVCVCVCVYACVCAHICVCACVRVCMRVCMRMCMRVCMRACVRGLVFIIYNNYSYLFKLLIRKTIAILLCYKFTKSAKNKMYTIHLGRLSCMYTFL